MTDLARGGRAVVFYDQTGNGKSTHFPDRGADFYTVGLFARELDNLISHLGISDRYHVLGQSWGGMLAQEHAITPVPLQNSPRCCDLQFGRTGRLRQDRRLCPFACST
jgi:L-proline amide hydrolase